MKKSLLKLAYTIVIFVVSVILISRLMNRGEITTSAEMSDARLPLVQMISDGEVLNTMHGYTEAIDVSTYRGTVTALENRYVQVQFQLYGTQVSNMYFEVRSLDGEDLIEQSYPDHFGIAEGADIETTSFFLKELIEYDTEYMLVLVLDIKGIGEARYYTRVICPSDGSLYHQSDKVAFVKWFHENTFLGAEELATYIESNSSGDNRSFAKVDIHSSFSRLTYEGLEVTAHTEPSVSVYDLHEETGSFVLDFVVAVTEDGRLKDYHVTESYMIRYTSQRIYLIDYKRTMNLIFTAAEEDIAGGVLNLSHTDPELALTENDSGSAVAFVNENRLFLYRLSDNSLSCVFGFYDAAHPDERTRMDTATIQVLQVSEGGGMRFVVSGYMSRGVHEGRVGTAVYDYNATMNTVEELAFFPENRGEEIVRTQMKRLLVVNNSDVLFTLAGGDLYAVNLMDLTSECLIEDANAGGYVLSEGKNLFACQGTDENGRPGNIIQLNLNTRESEELRPADGGMVRLLGYMGEDLIYGAFRESTILHDSLGNEVYAMYRVFIRSRNGEILNEYPAESAYVSEIEVVGNQIVLHRILPDGAGSFTETTDDQIVSNKTQQGVRNTVVLKDTETGALTQIKLRDAVDGASMKYLTPEQTQFAEAREVTLPAGNAQRMYYAYADGKVIAGSERAGDAVLLAYVNYGVAVDDRNRYLFYRGNLLTRNQNMTLTNAVAGREYLMSPLRACIETALEYEGVGYDEVEGQIAAGLSLSEILEEAMPEKQVLDLTGCPLQAMLYYANRDIPVFATLNDGRTVLLIGFNEFNTVLFDPSNGEETVYKYGMADSRRLFSESGNRFVTYIDG